MVLNPNEFLSHSYHTERCKQRTLDPGTVQDVVVLAELACRWQALSAEQPRVRKHVELKERKRK